MMLKQELIHSHILVAMFCGWEPQKPNKEFPNGYLWMRESDEAGDTHWVSNDDILEEIPYAIDWNYLMTAYDVFRDVAEKGYEEDELMKIRDSIIDAILEVNIDLAFKELVRGIDTHNQLKLQDT